MKSKKFGDVKKELSPSAMNLILNHSWPGNVRELQNTLRQAVVWSDGNTINKADMQACIRLQIKKSTNGDQILNQSIENGINLPELVDQVKVHYLKRAWETTGKSKRKTTELLSLSSYQVLSNWLVNYGIE